MGLSSYLVGKPDPLMDGRYCLGGRDPLRIHHCILWEFQGEPLGVRLPGEWAIDVADALRRFLVEWQEPPLSFWPIARGVPRAVTRLCLATVHRWRERDDDWQFWNRAAGGLIPDPMTLGGFHVFKR